MLSTGEVGGVRAQARAALDALGEGLGVGAATGGVGDALSSPPAVGDTVQVTAFGSDAVVRAVSGDQIDVDMRGKRMRVRMRDLRRAATPGAGGASASERRRGEPRVSRPEPAASGAAARELMVIGATVDEAIGRAEKFLDDALLADERRLRIVHGHGTGRLRAGIRAFFRGHPLVASVAAAADNEGGDGATIVELKD